MMVVPNCNVIFQLISDRTDMIKATSKNKVTCNTIRVYARTLEKTVKDPEQTRKFYDQLSFIINKVTITGEDFNAKTKIERSVKDHILNKTTGRCPKSKINKNGEKLIEFCSLHNLRITNTLFEHKPIHQTN